MMRTIQFMTATLICVVSLRALQAAESPAADTKIAQLFQFLVPAEGASYFSTRSNLVACGTAAVTFLEAKQGGSDLHERVLAAAVLSWTREEATNYTRTKLLRALLREANRFRGDHLTSLQLRSDPVVSDPFHGLIRLQDALHEDAAVPLLLEVALKGPGSIPGEPPWMEKDVDYSVQAKGLAIALVGGYKGSDVLAILKEMLQSPDRFIRVCAATGLHWGKTSEGTEMLLDGLSDTDPRVRSTCSGALADLTDQDFGDNRSAWLEWWQQNKKHWPFNDRVPGHKWGPRKWVSPPPAAPQGGTPR